MKENIIDVLMYLFENHMEENCHISLNEELLLNELKEAGFDIKSISKAFDWLDGLAELSKTQPINPASFRVLNIEEHHRLSAESWGYLLFLEQVKIIDSTTREIILDRLMNLSNNKIELSQVKWVALMVLFNQQGYSEALKALEQLVLVETDQIN